MLFSQPNRYYTIRYLSALSIIAFLVILNYIVIYIDMHNNANMMPTLEMSTEQKILPQQIAYWSLEMVLAEDKAEKKRLKDTLFASVRKLNANYRKLSQDANEMDKNLIIDEEILNMYKYPPHDVDIHFETFRDTVARFLSLSPKKALILEKEYLRVIQDLAADELWYGFDEILKGYNQTFERRIEKLKHFELGILTAFMITLLLEGIFLFRPMVNTIAREKQNLLQSQRLVNSVMKTVAEGILTINDKHEIIIANQEIKKYWGYTFQELNKKPFVELIDLDKSAIFKQIYQAKGINGWLGKDIELIGIRKDGSQFPLELKVSSTALDGETFFTAAINDISERKKIELALLESKNNLEERVRSRTIELKNLNKDLKREVQERKAIEMELANHAAELTRSNGDLKQFAYIASHDLKEPLRMITGYVQLLQRKYGKKLDVVANEYIQYAVEGAERSNKLIDDLLQYSSISNKQKLEYVNTEKIALEVEKNLQLYIKERKAVLELKNLPIVYANGMQLLHVFQNLISNAIKFNKSERPIVKVYAEEQDENYTFYIRDNGIGIEEDYKEKIFLIFQRLHSRADYSGTGVGLAVCKKIIERHGGKIDFHSKYGEGTTFFFSLPKKKNT